MEFWVKLVLVCNNLDVAEKVLDHRICGRWFLFEGDIEAVDNEDFEYVVFDKAAIQGYGDLSGKEIIEMVLERFDISERMLTDV